MSQRARESALSSAPVRLDATYTTAYIAHTPLETRIAVARWEDDRATECGFADADRRTLYISARSKLFRVRTARPGVY